MLFLAWPYPTVLLQRVMADGFVAATVAAGQFAVRFLRLPYALDPTDSQVFTSTHLPESQNFTLIVGQLCSGTAVTLGFFVVGAGLVLMSSGKAEQRMKWLLTGLGLSFVSNLLRVGVLLAGEI